MKTTKKTAATPAKNALVKLEGNTQIAPWMQEAMEEASADAAKFQQGLPRISFKGGRISVDGKTIGDTMDVVIVEGVFGKAYYLKKFKEGEAQVPTCYGFSADSAVEIKPHAGVKQPVAAECKGCPWNKFNTALDDGKGKRCKDEVRALAIVGDTDPDSMSAAEARSFTIPPGSLKAWGAYVSKLKDLGQSFRTVVTRVTCVPFKGAYKLEFSPVGGLNEFQYGAIKSRRNGAAEQLMQPYPDLDSGEAAKAEPKRTEKTGRKARA